MEVIEEKLWSILKLTHNGELNPVSMEYLKQGLGGFFAKYVYDRDLNFVQFTKWLGSDIEYKRVDILVLAENLSKIYHLHRDFESAVLLRKIKLKKMLSDGKSEKVSLEYYILANWFFEKGNFKEALQNITLGIKSIDTKNLTKENLKVLIESMIMKEQLNMLLPHDTKLISDNLEKLLRLVIETSMHISTKDSNSLKVRVYALIVSNNIEKKEYTKAILVGNKAIELIDKEDLNLKTMLKYYLFEKLSYAYLFEKNHEKAIEISRKALGLKEQLITLPVYSVLVILVESYLAQKEYDEALRYAHEANSYVNNSVDKLEYIYEILSKLYSYKGDNKIAKEYQDKLKHLAEGVKHIV